MRLVIQRVIEASVTSNGKIVSKIGKGILILLGITTNDTPQLAENLASKALKIRLWTEIPKNKPKQTKTNPLPSKSEPTESKIETVSSEKIEQTSEKAIILQENKEKIKEIITTIPTLMPETSKNPWNEEEVNLKKWHTNLMENDYEVIVVSQFTLYGFLKGNKPDFHYAMSANDAKAIYEIFLNKMKKEYKPDKVFGGAFQEYMHVNIVGDGPVTLILDSDKSPDLQKEHIE